MKKYRLNLDDIEEVQYAPRKRHMHTHTHNYSQNNTKSVNISYDENHLHNDNHIINNTNSINGGNNDNQHQHKHHHHRHGPPQWTEFGCKQIMLMTIFGISMAVILLSFIINLVLTIKQVVTPKIFFPSIIYVIFSFSCAGGIMGTYLVPPHRRNNPFRKNELLIMRVFLPAVMLVVSILFLLIGGDNINSLKEGLNRSEDLCKNNKGLSMEEIYIKTNETTNELITQKENMKYSYKNNLFCYPNARCVKYYPNTDSNISNYICNSQEFIVDELSKIKCDIINIKENSNKFLNNIKYQKNANLFINNCLDLSKNLFKTEINLFKCESEYDLENIKFTKNLSLESDINFKEYLNKKIKKNIDDIKIGKEIIYKYENSRYDYDLDCLNSNDYFFSRLLLNIYLYIFYAFCIFWIIFGIISMHRLINLGIEGKLEFLNDGDREQRQSINNKINISEDDGEVNKLIIANK